MHPEANLPIPKKKRKRIFSKQTKLSHVKAWKASGQSLSSYSKQHELSLSSLSNWAKNYKNPIETENFKPILVKPKVSLNSQLTKVIEIKLINGIQLKLPYGDHYFLSELLRILNQCN